LGDLEVFQEHVVCVLRYEGQVGMNQVKKGTMNIPDNRFKGVKARQADHISVGTESSSG
jgi:hypothetical protein